MVREPQALTVILWLWNGWRPIYNYKHVNATVRMLADYLPIPHRVVCVTDTPEQIECETHPLWALEIKVRGLPVSATGGAAYPNSYRRLKMFSPWAAEQFPGQILSLDLDAVICDDISPLITNDDFKINKGRAAPYNGGMWLLRTGTRTEVWEKFHPNAFAVTSRQRFTGSDQAWISHVLKNEKTWDAPDGVYHYALLRNTGRSRPPPGNGRFPMRVINRNAAPQPQPQPDDCRIMFCAGGIKMWHPEFGIRFPALAEHYRKYLR
jgi:hypothetical protein